ncbi:aminopeptidase P family protein [Aliiroseovarius sp. PrR006]|uniref:aminopeptidase P family protein n=1 Tax=Aliiroseovarius sp. PrR006 TaxID=2706883 RepID=UPI0013D5625F|nr:M24B family metallopeptidase [Aliiroseovarius sp. PrR006]NDW54649.1 aminopeptidase P family protein [Aliiroseovarius sp. PrR006]
MPDEFHTGAAQHIAALRTELERRGLDAFIVPRFDAHQGEYVAPHDERLSFVTGFTGSAGMALVTPDIVAVFVDGRYSVQLENECPGPDFLRLHLLDQPPETWLADVAGTGWRIAFDPMHLPPIWYDRFAAACTNAGASFVALTDNPIDAIWEDQPAPPKGQITPFSQQFAGRSATDKIAELGLWMKEQGADFHVETQPDNIAWLLNVRGEDVDYNPMPQSCALVDREGMLTWFVDPQKLSDEVRDHIPAASRLCTMQAFLPELRTRLYAGARVLIDPDFSPVAVRLTLEEAGAEALEKLSQITLAKAQKNATELEGMRAAHVQDGVALTEFSAWLEQTVPARAAAGNPVSEREAEEKVLEFRKARPGFLSESFNTISAAGGNASMCHYATSQERNAPVLPDRPYLLDSGGQYETGTTDATRSFSFGPRPAGYDRAYTAVFKAFYALATLRFPHGTQGHHIDAISRRPLWDLGLDYDHGTGHGVGHRLSVHEHPQRIGKPVNLVDLTPGMVLSIEPGHYVAERYGIRIENLFEIIEAEDGFMEFRNLTLAPIQAEMLRAEDLTRAEKNWLINYHNELGITLGPLLSPIASDWLSLLKRRTVSRLAH